MNVLVIADPFLPIPPVGYGGGERIVDLLCRGLTEKGHHVRLIASAGSTTAAELVAHPEQSIAHRWYHWRRTADLALFGRTLGRAMRGIDVVHSFKSISLWWPLPALMKQPLVVTFENPISNSHVEWLLRIRERRLRLCSISLDQRRHAPAGPWSTVYNATDADLFRYSEAPRNPPYLLFLGRISPIKGTHLAIEAAHKAGLDLVIAGNISAEPGGREYFQAQVAPKLNDRVRWVGEVTDTQKIELCGGALALLFPIEWPEPFGIVMIESMFCGTPVIAFNRGSVPEVVEQGKTGYVVETAEEMAAAAGRIGQISRGACARVARERFSRSVMVERYVEIYRELLGQAGLPPSECAEESLKALPV
ncbi:MAG TPA: glycosyltransferase family 4 protein [Bryobacteraceae bacterium]|nr:glycosyltransferase family 4 protein [Bryobacteraceae bacterium]